MGILMNNIQTFKFPRVKAFKYSEFVGIRPRSFSVEIYKERGSFDQSARAPRWNAENETDGNAR